VVVSMDRRRPYGWGCVWEGSHCSRYADRGVDACMSCHRVLNSGDRAKWLEFLESRREG